MALMNKKGRDGQAALPPEPKPVLHNIEKMDLCTNQPMHDLIMLFLEKTMTAENTPEEYFMAYNVVWARMRQCRGKPLMTKLPDVLPDGFELPKY